MVTMLTDYADEEAAKLVLVRVAAEYPALRGPIFEARKRGMSAREVVGSALIQAIVNGGLALSAFHR